MLLSKNQGNKQAMEQKTSPTTPAAQQRVAAHATHIRSMRERRNRGGGMMMLWALFLFVTVFMFLMSVGLAIHARDTYKFSPLEQRVKLTLLQHRQPRWGAGGL